MRLDLPPEGWSLTHREPAVPSEGITTEAWDQLVSVMAQLVEVRELAPLERANAENEALKSRLYPGGRPAPFALADGIYLRANEVAEIAEEERRLVTLERCSYTWAEVLLAVSRIAWGHQAGRLRDLPTDKLERLRDAVDAELESRKGWKADATKLAHAPRVAFRAEVVAIDTGGKGCPELPAWIGDWMTDRTFPEWINFPGSRSLGDETTVKVRFVFTNSPDNKEFVVVQHPHGLDRWRQVVEEGDLYCEVRGYPTDPVLGLRAEAIDREGEADRREKFRSDEWHLRWVARGFTEEQREELRAELDRARETFDLEALDDLLARVQKQLRPPETADNGVVPPVSGASGAAS